MSVPGLFLARSWRRRRRRGQLSEVLDPYWTLLLLRREVLAHFNMEEFTWEKADLVEKIKKLLK